MKFDRRWSIAIIVAAIFVIGGLVAALTGGFGLYKTAPKGNDITKNNTQNNTKNNAKNNTKNNNTTNNQGQNNVDEGKATPEPQKEKVKVKALYLTGWTVGSSKSVQHYIDLAKRTEINSYVVDIKDDDGYVGYESSIPEVKKNKAWMKKYDADSVLKAFHENDIYVIGRLVCFKDPVLSSKRTDLAIKRTSGGVWRDRNGKTWLNPYSKEAWPYLIDIAKEAVEKGFDEIQFDYIRFANDGDKNAMYFGKTTKERHEIINEFLAYAKKELPGVVISADVFGIICESPGDTEKIGQNLEFVGKDIDYISPMAYPSHYAVGQIVNKVRFAKPDFDPYGVVYNTLVKAKNRIAKVKDYKANVRPYLQDFTATWLGEGYYKEYGANEVRQQIKATYDAGYDEWIFWDAKNTYHESAFLKEK